MAVNLTLNGLMWLARLCSTPCYFFDIHGTVKQASLPLGSWAMAYGLNALTYKIFVRCSTT